MKKKIIFINYLILFFMLFGCDSNKSNAESKHKNTMKSHQKPITNIAKNNSNETPGVVVETMNSGGYSYALVEKSGEKLWAAAPKTNVKVGDSIELPTGTLMKRFTSNTLKKTFENINFVPYFLINGKMSNTAQNSSHAKNNNQSKNDTPQETISVKKIKGGYSVAEIFSKREVLKGKKIKIKGKVIKFNKGIMGKNWIHLKDGTGKSGSNDLTLTTQEIVNPNEIITLQGIVKVDKDFGGGYFYPVIVEETTVVHN